MSRFLLVIALLISLFVALRWNSARAIPSEPIIIARDERVGAKLMRGRDRDLLAFSDELVEEVLLVNGVKVDTRSISSNGLFNGLELGAFDAVLTTQTPTAHLLSTYAYSNPFFKTGLILLLPKDSTHSSLEELSGLVLGVPLSHSYPFSEEEISKFRIKGYKDEKEAIEELIDGSYDGILIGNVIAHSWSSGIYSDKIKTIGPVLTTGGIYFVVMRGDAELLIEVFNEGLQTLENGGRYHFFLEKWQIPQ